MVVRPITAEEKDRFNSVATHPTQSWQWGDFRQATGQQVERFGVFSDSGEIQMSVQATFHSIPVIGGTAGYVPRGPIPDATLLTALKDLGRRHNAVFIKLEPNQTALATESNPFAETEALLKDGGAVPGRSLFTRYTYIEDLRPSEDELLALMKSKTRYNVKLAEKRGVQIVEDTSLAGLETYLTLLKETTNRQGFYAHNEQYFRTMWEVIGQTGMMRILRAEFEGKTISTWILFVFNGVGYYPYGASSREHREVMANNLMMWEALKLAKREGCTSFDMWGALGLNPDPENAWYGFHRFKEGYGAPLYQALGTHDLVINPPVYSIFKIGDALRWKVLRLRTKLGI